MKQRIQIVTRGVSLELILWMGGLIFLAAMNPAQSALLDLCLFKKLGLPFCPGCGLGHSVSWLLHGDVMRSLEVHPLGPAALLILSIRIITLSNRFFQRARAVLPDAQS
jgi:hypothetical protein